LREGYKREQERVREIAGCISSTFERLPREPRKVQCRRVGDGKSFMGMRPSGAWQERDREIERGKVRKRERERDRRGEKRG